LIFVALILGWPGLIWGLVALATALLLIVFGVWFFLRSR